MPIKTRSFFHFLCLGLIAALFGFVAPAHASTDAPMLDDARADLEKAWNPAGDPPSAADRTTLLNHAYGLLKDAPPGSSIYYRHLAAARRFIKAALYELGKGDPDQKATDLIHSAVSEIREIT